ncbi:hypothetical protein FNV43_RR01695 [Rhamnella rubrinervis]|uniref:RNase H type-1 domain-containing protein n=1 Tax=Rhamnella rubrinervis TaxID=2594499 RepID=A0A8K0HRZ1_9ROSA|nr:hypothetical protein FNV43_RR01695 [Rhamnella rubrinervis]
MVSKEVQTHSKIIMKKPPIKMSILGAAYRLQTFFHIYAGPVDVEASGLKPCSLWILQKEFTEAGKKEGISSSSTEDHDLMNWRPPQQGFLKVNVDAALANTTAAAAMVVRDDHGNVLLLASKLFTCNSAFDAEVEALGGAAGHADGGKWNGKRMQSRLPIILIQRRILMAGIPTTL